MMKPKTTGMKLYKSYMFVEKDPVIDIMRTVIQNKKASYKEIHQDSGVSVSAITSWFHGKTKRPQFATCQAVMKSLGHEFVIKRRGN